jgi:hypothetical protein
MCVTEGLLSIKALLLSLIFEVKTMKLFLCSLLAFANLFCASAMADENSRNKLTLKIRAISPSGGVTAEIYNSSREPIRIWKDSNSWGAARWRVLRVRNGQVETFFQNPEQAFSKNTPSFDEIAGGGHVEQKLDVNRGNWCGFAQCSSYNEQGLAGQKVTFESKDLIIVVYDVPFFPESLQMDVWYGVAVTFTTVK